ncbi:jg8384 [Pararge aegeria aegeria]|uniref:Jg8384 protein n=1 Tax=Pararge aegeria aegeria TaxID=348720 RepID=A0A8S4SPQ0_9NEOP|nr:jg8384 [Pararge aegeria aegeria]
MLQSRRGKPLILYNQYTYCRHSSITCGRTRWVCSTHSYRCCKAVVITRGTIIEEVKGYHNHASSELLINRFLMFKRSKPGSSRELDCWL